LNGDYDAMIGSNEQAVRACGTALAALEYLATKFTPKAAAEVLVIP
jgi:hypothetical protein